MSWRPIIVAGTWQAFINICWMNESIYEWRSLPREKSHCRADKCEHRVFFPIPASLSAAILFIHLQLIFLPVLSAAIPNHFFLFASPRLKTNIFTQKSQVLSILMFPFGSILIQPYPPPSSSSDGNKPPSCPCSGPQATALSLSLKAKLLKATQCQHLTFFSTHELLTHGPCVGSSLPYTNQTTVTKMPVFPNCLHFARPLEYQSFSLPFTSVTTFSLFSFPPTSFQFPLLTPLSTPLMLILPRVFSSALFYSYAT